jgi:hypothetical protein
LPRPFLYLQYFFPTIKGKGIPVTGMETYRAVNVEAPTYCRQSAHRWRWGCQPYAPATLHPRNIFHNKKIIIFTFWGFWFTWWSLWRLLCYRRWCHVVWYISTNVSEEPAASIFREGRARMRLKVNQWDWSKVGGILWSWLWHKWSPFWGHWIKFSLHIWLVFSQCQSLVWQFFTHTAYSSTLEVVATGFSERLVPVYEATWCHIPENRSRSICYLS